MYVYYTYVAMNDYLVLFRCIVYCIVLYMLNTIIYFYRGVYLQITKTSSSDARLIPVSQLAMVGENTDPQSCETLLKTRGYLNESEFNIQLIAAAPGSGSDWCLRTISLITGKQGRAEGVPHF